jgi:aryl sulfotransferase
MAKVPNRTRDYIGSVTGARIWDQLDLRPGDIILSTPPKSGTTWSPAMLMILLEGAAATDRAIWRE